MELTPDAQIAVDVIIELGGLPLIVGGAVRDYLLDIPSKDIDIEVHGECSWLHLTEALREHGRVDLVGASFGVIKFGAGQSPVDISFPRRDSKVRGGHTGFMIDVDPTMTIKEALSRRDFTMNSIAYNPVTGEFVDPFNGMKDILSRTIRHTSDAFKDDPLRVMRAVQFSSRFMFDIADETGQLCAEMADSFHELSIERIWIEWEKILNKGKSMEMVTTALRRTGWIEHFPGWQSGVGGHGVDTVLEQADKDSLPPAWRAGVVLGAQFVRRTTALSRFLAAIDAPIWLKRGAMAIATDITVDGTHAQQVRQMARILEKQGCSLDLYLRARQLKQHALGIEAEREQVLFECDKPLLTGTDLQAFGLVPGPAFSTILGDALKAQDWFGWISKAEAFEWYREHYDAQ